ncbi:MAG: phytanoyl-CoA dioxygenase family protein [Gammaproteobacteria bacterium]|nr:phytanoyl-CoA dioxygenase family protein [Gammaproteobacteria bacterium]
MIDDYEKNGYLVLKSFFSETELYELRQVVSHFHEEWKLQNAQFYAESAINSAYLTAEKYLKASERESLFRFIGSGKLMTIVTSIMGDRPAFMNTQLFFDPVNKAQRNYWHRDTQYHLSIEQQQQALSGPKVVHFRIPLFDEPGIELIPGSHQRWDSDEELYVRLEQNGRKNYNELSSGVAVPLNAGDLLIFSASMIHRGLYGRDRLSLDILFCDPVPELMKFVDDSSLPSPEIVAKLENAVAFECALASKTKNSY